MITPVPRGSPVPGPDARRFSSPPRASRATVRPLIRTRTQNVPPPAHDREDPGENTMGILNASTCTTGSKAGSSRGIWERGWAHAGTALVVGGPVSPMGPPKLGMPHFGGEATSSYHPSDAETAKLVSQVSGQWRQAAAPASSRKPTEG